jgi:sulfhydrogenase subunit gamma (sulfur reductase)
VNIARITAIEPDGHDTATYWVELTDPGARARYSFEAGQINMVYLWGLGEVPISVSSDPVDPSRLAHTIRIAGSVTAGCARLRVGDEIGLRGPFGRPWPIAEADGGDLVVVTGGLGLAPLRSAIYVALRQRHRFRRVVVLVGARTPGDVVYRQELETWRHRPDVEVALTVDRAEPGWPHHVGLVTALLDGARLDPVATTALLCGPEPMMVATADQLTARGIDPARTFLSMERNMQCGLRRCGHCQLGPKFVCADGPVFSVAELEPWLRVAHL